MNGKCLLVRLTGKQHLELFLRWPCITSRSCSIWTCTTHSTPTHTNSKRKQTYNLHSHAPVLKIWPWTPISSTCRDHINQNPPPPRIRFCGDLNMGPPTKVSATWALVTNRSQDCSQQNLELGIPSSLHYRQCHTNIKNVFGSEIRWDGTVPSLLFGMGLSCFMFGWEGWVHPSSMFGTRDEENVMDDKINIVSRI
jgi:hypothetical protein